MIAIVALDKNRCIGNAGKLAWPVISQDFSFFKKVTYGKAVIMGRKTYESLGRTFLPNRRIQILTSGKEWASSQGENTSVEAFNNPDDLDENAIVCGGAEIYALFLPKITTFYITKVAGDYVGDTYLKPFEALFKKKELLHTLDGGHEIWKYTR